MDATFLHDLHFGFGGVVCAADDGAGVAHGTTFGRRLAGNKTYHRFGAEVADIAGGICFHAAADLADHNDALRFGVIHQQFHCFFGGGAHDGVAADADAGGLAHAGFRHLVHCLVGEGAGTRNDADVALAVNEARHDAAFGLVGRDDAGAVGADEAAVFAGDVGFHLHHVLHGDALGDADDDFDACFGGLHDGVGSKCRRHEDDRCVGAGLLNGIVNGVEYRLVQVGFAAFAGRDAAYYVGTVFNHLGCVESTFFAGESLDDDF